MPTIGVYISDGEPGAETLHHHRRHHRIGTAQGEQPRGTDHRQRADRIDARRVRSGRRPRARPRSQRRSVHDVEPGQVRRVPGAHPQDLPGDHRAVLHRRTLRRRVGAGWHAAPSPGHGVALDRLVQLPHAGLRELTRSDRGAGGEDAPLQREARDRGVRPRHAVQRGELRTRGAHQSTAARAVRARRQALAAGPA